MADDKVIDLGTRLPNRSVGDGYVFSPERLMAEVIETKPRMVAVAFIDGDGRVRTACTHGSSDFLALLERGKFHFLHNC